MRRDGDAAVCRARLLVDRDRGDFQAGRILATFIEHLPASADRAVGIVRALIVCGVLQSRHSVYVLQAIGGHRLDYLALCVAAETDRCNAGAALVAYLSACAHPRHREPIRAALFASGPWTHAGGRLGGVWPNGWMGAIFSAHDGSRLCSPCAACSGSLGVTPRSQIGKHLCRPQSALSAARLPERSYLFSTDE